MLAEPELEGIRPDGRRFLFYVELMQQRNEMKQQRNEMEQQRDRLAAKLQELGIDPTQL